MKSKIFIIDPSEHFTTLLISRLNAYGYMDCSAVDSAQEGLRRVMLESPDIVIVSTHVKDADPYSICQHIKEWAGEAVKVILLPVSAGLEGARKAKDAGADDYVAKTLDCVFLITAIKKQLMDKMKVAL